MNKVPMKSLPTQYTKHLGVLLDWLFDEIDSASGDGDATWVVLNFDIMDVREFIIIWLHNNAMSEWKVSDIRDGTNFSVADGQEMLFITTDESLVPPWSQCTIKV